MKNMIGKIFILGLVSAFVVGSGGCSKAPETNTAKPAPASLPDTNAPEVLLAQRQELDKTVWAPEVEAQKHEGVFIKLWDVERNAEVAAKMGVLAEFPILGGFSLGVPSPAESLESGVSLTTFSSVPGRTFKPNEWKDYLRSLEKAGVQVVQTEWHHSRFVPASQTNAAKSTVSFAIHAVKEATKTTYAVKGDLDVLWASPTNNAVGGIPVVDSIMVSGLTLLQREGGGLFKEVFNTQSVSNEFASAYPVLVYDLNSDGFSEIILPRWNRVYWNQGGSNFLGTNLLDHPIPIWEAGILSDFNGDGNVDFVTVGKDGSPYFYAGTEQGKFPAKPVICSDVKFEMPTAVTAGDADGDGDLDLWMTQYKLSFVEGQMPTPYYDANDGPPSYFLINDGNGAFTDVTESAGLAPLRHRRTYSASFIDLDEDGDLDLINVADYAGLDIYRNTGKGKFQLATESYVKDRHFFGMGHTFGDYNGDGRLDMYVIGMSSTTARRLDRLNLGRSDRPDVHPMRAAMGYGNRLYFGTPEKTFQEIPKVAAAVARTGWSWGVTTFDFDLDGDQDIYVANGHRSGKSCQDYCTTFWTHDIYTGDSKENPQVLKVFETSLSGINRDEISWNGYEKNVLFVNHPTRSEIFVNNSFMFGTAYPYDARSVVSDDLNNDGRPDLVVAESVWIGRGFGLVIHIYANQITTSQSNNWFAVRLRESAGPGFSPNGAKVAITDDLGRVQTRWIVSGDSFLAQHAAVAHFGLGQAKQVKFIDVTWPNGKTERHSAGATINTTVILRGGDPALSQP